MSHSPIRPRQGCDLPVTIDNYSKVESRQEMGFKLNTFMNTVTGDPHSTILMAGEASPVFRKTKNSKNRHARTAKNPYTVEVN